MSEKRKSEKIISPDLISFDYAIKFLLKDKSDFGIVEGFISAILSSAGYSPVKITARLDGESEKEESSNKGSLADVIVADEQGEMYIVEIDRAPTSLFMHKACFNTSRLIVDTIGSGEDYSKIKKVIHINIIYFSASDMKSTMKHGRVIFHEIDRDHPQDIHLEDLGARAFDAHDIFPEYFVITIPRFDDVIKNEMDEWLYMLKHSRIAEGAKSPYMKKVAERLNMLKMSRAERKAYMNYRGKVLKDRDYLVTAEAKGIAKGKAEGIAEGIAKGKAEGIAEGIEKGIEKGEVKKKKEIARKMLAKGKEIEEVMEFTDLSKEEIEGLK